MYKLFTDKQENFECTIQLEGASLSKSQARLVISTKDVSFMFEGSIDSNGKCNIPVRKLKGLLEENNKGEIKLEVIAEDTYFIPWKSNFIVESSKKVTVEVASQGGDLIKESKPSVKVKNIKEVTQTEKDHVVNLLKLLVKENINIENIVYSKNKLNKIVATYVIENQLTEDSILPIIEGITKGLAILK